MGHRGGENNFWINGYKQMKKWHYKQKSALKIL
jgi:hypothetical protein